MSNSGKPAKSSKGIIWAWIIMLSCFAGIFAWTQFWPAPQLAETSSLTRPVDIDLPDPIPVEEYIIKDEVIEVDNDRAELDPTDHTIYEDSKHGPLPKISGSGRMAYTEFAAAAVPSEKKTKIVFIFSDLGQDEDLYKKILDQTPPQVTLGFLPFIKDTDTYVKQARKKGHEVLLNIAMESSDLATSDPGPRALLTGLESSENIDRLQWFMSRTKEYIGVMNYKGSLFMASSADLQPILSEVKSRGLMFVESSANFRSQADEIALDIELPYVKSQFEIPNDLTLKDLHAELIRAEQTAQQSGLLVIVAHASPRTIPILLTWIKKASEKDYDFIPASQYVNQYPLSKEVTS